MEYERIHKVQMGVLSPTKLRMKLLGTHNSRNKEGRNNSSRASPSKIEEMEYAKNSLLGGHLDDEAHPKSYKGGSQNRNVANLEAVDLPVKDFPHHIHYAEVNKNTHATDSHSKEEADTRCMKLHDISKNVYQQVPLGSNLSLVHPMRSLEEDGNCYDSGHDNGSTSSFEFHRGERISQNPKFVLSARNLPSKWNDAEKWIVNRQTRHPNFLKRSASQKQANRQVIPSGGRVAPESTIADQRHPGDQAADNRNKDIIQPILQNEVEKFSFFPHRSQTNLVSATETTVFTDIPPLADSGSRLKFQKEQNHKEASVEERSEAVETVVPMVQSVSMRDVGTEMTPTPSQEPSRTETPIGPMTPSRSPNSSTPSTPRRGTPAPSPVNMITDGQSKGGKFKFSERELHLKTRREIATLGMQLGKMSIVSWANKEVEHIPPPLKPVDAAQMVKREYETRAVAWEEAEKAKHMARYAREEVNIQAWESHQRAKLEAKMRKIEVQAEQMRACAQEKMVEELAVTRQRAEEKQAAAVARMSRQAARTAQQAEYIRQTGRIPSSHILRCSCLF